MDQVNPQALSSKADSAAYPQIIEFELANGLHLLFLPRHEIPLVTLNLWYHVGSKDEDPSRTGFAHLFEHMMFQGSKHIGATEHFKYIQQAGGTLNASTNQDRTNYYQTLPASELELGLWLESDRMLDLSITQENFDNQLAVVKEERRQRYDNRPYGRVYEELLKLIFPTSGYHWSTIGSMEHLEAATLEEVNAFHKRFYLPNNASLAIIGDISETSAYDLVAKYFGDIPAGLPIERRDQSVAPIQSEVRSTMLDDAPLPMINIAWQAPLAFESEAYPLDLLADLLGSGRSSRLYVALVYEKRIAKEVSVTHFNNEKSGIFLIQATLQPGRSLEEAETAIWEVLTNLLATGFSEQEFEKTKNRSEMRNVRSLTALSSQADRIQRGYTFRRNASLGFSEIESLMKVQSEEVLAAAKKLLLKETSVCLTVVPGRTGAKTELPPSRAR